MRLFDYTNKDVLTKLFDNSKYDRLIGEVKGITRSKLNIINKFGDKITILEEEQHNMKIQITEILNLVEEHLVTIRSCTCTILNLYC